MGNQKSRAHIAFQTGDVELVKHLIETGEALEKDFHASTLTTPIFSLLMFKPELVSMSNLLFSKEDPENFLKKPRHLSTFPSYNPSEPMSNKNKSLDQLLKNKMLESNESITTTQEEREINSECGTSENEEIQESENFEQKIIQDVIDFQSRRKKLICLYTQEGGNINHRDKDGWTLLSHAIASGDLQLASLCLFFGGKSTFKNKTGMNSLDILDLRIQQMEDNKSYHHSNQSQKSLLFWISLKKYLLEVEIDSLVQTEYVVEAPPVSSLSVVVKYHSTYEHSSSDYIQLFKIGNQQWNLTPIKNCWCYVPKEQEGIVTLPRISKSLIEEDEKSTDEERSGTQHSDEELNKYNMNYSRYRVLYIVKNSNAMALSKAFSIVPEEIQEPNKNPSLDISNITDIKLLSPVPFQENQSFISSWNRIRVQNEQYIKLKKLHEKYLMRLNDVSRSQLALSSQFSSLAFALKSQIESLNESQTFQNHNNLENDQNSMKEIPNPQQQLQKSSLDENFEEVSLTDSSTSNSVETSITPPSIPNVSEETIQIQPLPTNTTIPNQTEHTYSLKEKIEERRKLQEKLLQASNLNTKITQIRQNKLDLVVENFIKNIPPSHFVQTAIKDLEESILKYDQVCKKYLTTKSEYERVLKLRGHSLSLLNEHTELLIKRIERDLQKRGKELEVSRFSLEGKLKLTEDKVTSQKQKMFKYYVTDHLNYFTNVSQLLNEELEKK